MCMHVSKMFHFIFQYGLYASFAGGFVYAIMGTCPQINIGPTALLSLLTFTYTSGTNPDFAVLLCFIGGIVTLVAGIAQLGMFVNKSSPCIAFTEPTHLICKHPSQRILLLIF